MLDQLIESEEGKALHESIKPLRAKDLELGNQFLELFAKEQWVEALALLESKQRPAQIEYQNAIRKQAELQAQVMAEDGHRAEAATRNVTQGLLIASAVTIGLALFLAITIIRSITRPLMQAVAVADRVATGNLSGQITVQCQDEMGHLLETLQHMQHSWLRPSRQCAAMHRASLRPAPRSRRATMTCRAAPKSRPAHCSKPPRRWSNWAPR
jgi:methyl-accepting chemotaxis protein